MEAFSQWRIIFLGSTSLYQADKKTLPELPRIQINTGCVVYACYPKTGGSQGLTGQPIQPHQWDSGLSETTRYIAAEEWHLKLTSVFHVHAHTCAHALICVHTHEHTQHSHNTCSGSAVWGQSRRVCLSAMSLMTTMLLIGRLYLSLQEHIHGFPGALHPQPHLEAH